MIKGLGINLRDSELATAWNQEVAPVEWSEEQPSQTVEIEELREMILQKNFAFIQGDLCLRLEKLIHQKAVSSHFLNYIDFVVNDHGQLWGHSVFSTAWHRIMIQSMQTQGYKGSVIFLGVESVSLPIMQELAQLGFYDFSFLDLSEEGGRVEKVKKSCRGLFNVTITEVDSTAFIQSQKEYSLCMVMRDQFEQQTLDDMSYFHFLSSESLVFDLSGRSNFLFDDVKALGVDVLSHSDIQNMLVEELEKTIEKRVLAKV